MVSATLRPFGGVLLGLGVLFGFAAPARADLTVCNKTTAPVVFAVAFETSQDLVSQGWWTVMPDQCQIALSVPLDRQFYYHYAVSQELKVEWRGNFNFCTSDDAQFRISGAQSCEQRNYRTTGFRQVDVGTNKDYVLNILNSAPAPAPAAGSVTTPPVVAAPPVTAPAPTPTTQTPAPTASAPIPAPKTPVPAPAAPAPVNPASPSAASPALPR